MKTTKPKKGLSIHLHHDVLVEYCYNYAERVKYIKEEKAVEEQETRLRLFKILPKEAEEDLPKGYLEAHQKWEEAYQKLKEAYQKREEAYQKWEEANQKWNKKSKEAFHKKWCGCVFWKNGVINFLVK